MNPSANATTEIAIAVVEHGGQYLIGLRPPDVPLPGLWEFPGGKLRPGETPAQAAQRECLEETGLAVVVGAAFPDVLHSYEHGRLRLHFYRCRLADPPAAAALSPRFRWVPGENLVDYEFPAANAELVARLARQPVTDMDRRKI